jgi:hypothetical protein
MKTFDQCKDEIAEKYGCLDWSDLINSPIEDDTRNNFKTAK